MPAGSQYACRKSICLEEVIMSSPDDGISPPDITMVSVNDAYLRTRMN